MVAVVRRRTPSLARSSGECARSKLGPRRMDRHRRHSSWSGLTCSRQPNHGGRARHRRERRHSWSRHLVGRRLVQVAGVEGCGPQPRRACASSASPRACGGVAGGEPRQRGRWSGCQIPRGAGRACPSATARRSRAAPSSRRPLRHAAEPTRWSLARCGVGEALAVVPRGTPMRSDQQPMRLLRSGHVLSAGRSRVGDWMATLVRSPAQGM
jgi:hypothetical protein